MTKHPDSLSQINYVVDFIADPCDAPFEAYARTAAPALLTLLQEYFAPDLLQVFTSYVRPNAGLPRVRSGGHGRTRQPRGKPRTWSQRWGRWLTFDPWDELGKRLPGGDDFRARNVTPGVHLLWEIYGHAQRLMYWFWLFDLVTDFFYNWMQGIYQTEHCQQLNRAWLSARRVGGTGTAIVGWSGITLPDVIKSRGFATWAGPGGSMIAETCTVTVIVNWRPTNEPFGATSVRCRIRTADRTVEGDDSTAEQGEASVGTTLRGPAVGFVIEYISDGFFETPYCSCTAIGNVGSGNLP